MRAEIKEYKGAMRLFVDGVPIAPDAYITYITPKACYEDFATAGYKLFSLPIFFSSKTLNEDAQYPAFSYALFESEEPRFDLVDEDFRKIIRACPDALIFPRVNISLSEAWERANPDELNDKGQVELHRPCFSSDKWAEETMRLYGMFIDHVKASDYADHVIGYQVAAGNTEEWIAHDRNGSTGKRSREKFAEWQALTGRCGSEENYFEFLSDVVAQRICDLARFTKERAGRDSMVGSFYGYSLQFNPRTECHNSFIKVLECPDIDFICSPVSYEQGRRLGRDHSCFVPWSSLAHHGKLYFAENDTRTHLTRSPFPENPYFDQPVFCARTKYDTLEMIKLHYSRAMIYGYAHWWFDMFGGWFADSEYMSLLKRLRDISEQSLQKSLKGVCEIGVFIDEKAINNVSDEKLLANFRAYTRDVIGNIGAPIDCYIVEDYEQVKDRYKAIIFLEACATERGERLKEDARSRGVGVFVINGDNYNEKPSVIREFCRGCGVHIYSNKDAVIYANESYLFVHSCSAGAPNINMPEGKTLIPLLDCDGVNAYMPEKFGRLFEIV